MTDFVIPPEELTYSLKKPDSLGLYEFDNKVAHHYFCKVCGIFPFLQTMRIQDKPRLPRRL